MGAAGSAALPGPLGSRGWAPAAFLQTQLTCGLPASCRWFCSMAELLNGFRIN